MVAFPPSVPEMAFSSSGWGEMVGLGTYGFAKRRAGAHELCRVLVLPAKEKGVKRLACCEACL